MLHPPSQSTFSPCSTSGDKPEIEVNLICEDALTLFSFKIPDIRQVTRLDW